MPSQRELDNLAKIYLAARERLLNTIISYKGVGTKVYANTVLRHLQKELEDLQNVSTAYINTEIPKEYEKGLKEVYDYFTKNSLLMKHPSLFASLHNDAIYSIAREMQFQIQQGLAQVGRQILRYVENSRDEALRAAGLAATGEKIASGSTVIQMKKNMIEKLQAEGFMTVQYGQGRKAYQVPLDSYAMLVARSTSREAGNIARENQLTANGYDLVQMDKHYPTCEICATLQGRVYSISGKDKRFPPLSRAFASGYHNVHPNCSHSIHPYIEQLQTEDERHAAIERSNRPFEDSRKQKEINLYNEQQAQNRHTRQDLHQYERYKARLGEDAPKSFTSFRKLKKAGGENWGVLEAQYRGMGYYENAVKNEPEITETAKNVSKEVGMKTAGLEYRIKTRDSYLRKIKSNYNPNGNEYEVKDILRYTLTTDSGALANKTLQSIDAFSQKGYNTVEIKNYWLNKSNPYNGINTTIAAPNGQKFEMQYHTPESFEIKNGQMHKLYEEWRLLPRDAPERSVLEEEMKRLSESMVPPVGIERVK